MRKKKCGHGKQSINGYYFYYDKTGKLRVHQWKCKHPIHKAFIDRMCSMCQRHRAWNSPGFCSWRVNCWLLVYCLGSTTVLVSPTSFVPPVWFGKGFQSRYSVPWLHKLAHDPDRPMPILPLDNTNQQKNWACDFHWPVRDLCWRFFSMDSRREN